MSDRQMHADEPRVAVDRSTLIAADSFFSPIDGSFQDPYSEATCNQVLDLYCSGAALYCPTPRQALTGGTPLMRTWTENATVLEGLAASGESLAKLAEDLAGAFIRCCESDAVAVSAWCEFELSPTIVQYYLASFGTVTDLDHVSGIACAILDEVPRFRSEIQRRQADGTIVLPAEYGQLGMGLPHLAVAYALAHYARGWCYAAGVAKHHAGPAYCPHWLRQQGQMPGTLPDIAVVRSPGHKVFPWGYVFRRLRASRHQCIPTDPKKLVELFARVRERSRDFVRQFHEIEAPNHQSWHEQSRKPTAREIHLVRFLHKVGVALPYRSSRLIEGATWLLELLGHGCPPMINKVIEKVTASLSPMVLRRWDMGTRLSLRRYRTLWHDFDGELISRAMDEWVRRNTTP